MSKLLKTSLFAVIGVLSYCATTFAAFPSSYTVGGSNIPVATHWSGANACLLSCHSNSVPTTGTYYKAGDGSYIVGFVTVNGSYNGIQCEGVASDSRPGLCQQYYPAQCAGMSCFTGANTGNIVNGAQ